MAVGKALPQVLGRSGAGLIAAIALGVLAACGTDAVGVDACRQIQEARCRQAPACNISLEPPYHSTGSDVDECIRLEDVACLHGLEVADPGPIAVSACVTAIQKDGCSVVTTPQSDPQCAWLNPPPSDAGSDGDASDADGTAGDDSSADGGND